VAEDCYICSTIRASDEGRNPGFVARLPSGYVVLNSQGQYYRGYAIFQSTHCVAELHDLRPRARSEFLRDMSLVAEAMFRAFRPAKLNYELLGNTVPHLHWHLVPRYRDDPRPKVPVWENEEFRASQQGPPRLAQAELDTLKRKLLRELTQLAPARIRATLRDVATLRRAP
jgi:diadenosine tetraphosphate (Ap4A) HIT family hydrolase